MVGILHCCDHHFLKFGAFFWHDIEDEFVVNLENHPRTHVATAYLTANFGIIYGISAFGLSERLSIPRSEAKELIEGYMATYPGVARSAVRMGIFCRLGFVLDRRPVAVTVWR